MKEAKRLLSRYACWLSVICVLLQSKLVAMPREQLPQETQTNPTKSEAKGYVTPFKVFDNIYYVGDKWVSSYLVSTDQGLVLVDTLEYPWSRWVPDNIQRLGFTLTDIKFVFITHGHSDHASGAGLLHQLTGAKLLMTEQSLHLMNHYFNNHPNVIPPEPAAINIVQDGQQLTLGTTDFIVHTTPGHTDGAISIELPAKKKQKSHRALIFGGVGTNYHTMELAIKYLNSVEKLKKLHHKKPFSVNLANHPHRANLFEKIKQRTNQWDPLIDASAFSDFLNQLQTSGELRRREIAYKLNNLSQ